MKAFGITHRGAVRKENQDAFRLELSEADETLTAVLCDGMGGALAGGLASALAADTFMYHAGNSLDESSSVADMKNILNESITFANARVYKRSYEDFDCMGMGCTLVGLLITGKRAVIANVGDSRAYLLSRSTLSQVTRDHSWVEDQVAQGKLTREKARSHPKKNIITRAIGVEASVSADLVDIRFPAGCRLLLCSDGLSNIVSEQAMLSVLMTVEDPEKACRDLLDQALENGAPDNVTVLVVQH